MQSQRNYDVSLPDCSLITPWSSCLWKASVVRHALPIYADN